MDDAAAAGAAQAPASWPRRSSPASEANPRYVVTSLKRTECKPKYLYEKLYCARGDMENRIKECQLDLYADRTSSATMRAATRHHLRAHRDQFFAAPAARNVPAPPAPSGATQWRACATKTKSSEPPGVGDRENRDAVN